MRRTKTIPAAEQVALCRRAQAGDLAARNALVTATMGLVYREAHRWVRSANGLELDDLAAEGAFGLIRAIEKFDCDRGLAFTTYATHWIRHSIRRAVLVTFCRVISRRRRSAMTLFCPRITTSSQSPNDENTSWRELPAGEGDILVFSFGVDRVDVRPRR